MSPVTGPGAARSVWELSPDPDMVGHLPNNLLSGGTHQNQNSDKSTERRDSNGPDDNIYAEAAPGQSPSDETKQIFDLLRARLYRTNLLLIIYC